MYERHRKPALPRTVDDVADLLLSDLMAPDIETLASMKETEFLTLYREVAEILLEEFHIWTGNDGLLQSCIEEIGDEGSHLDPALIILTRMRQKLRESVTGIYIIT